MPNNDAVLRVSLLYLGAIVLLIGLYTYSLKKMFATYAFGLFAIAGILLPDWDFFDRDFSEWVRPMSATDSEQSRSKRFRVYPIRLTVYTTIYGFGLYKWWIFVFNS
ncbi:hypothetical protein Sjap_015314 [Stephania japonica]|uniref:Signal peptidase complex-like protein DTM1 n=1 Tax=Stephania japonica TaxID=461633 RepID=A0AAP0IJ59_9MAGN